MGRRRQDAELHLERFPQLGQVGAGVGVRNECDCEAPGVGQDGEGDLAFPVAPLRGMMPVIGQLRNERELSGPRRLVTKVWISRWRSMNHRHSPIAANRRKEGPVTRSRPPLSPFGRTSTPRLGP